MTLHRENSVAAIARLQPDEPDEGPFAHTVGEGEHRALQAIMNAEATLELAAQQRIANKLQVALIDQLGELAKVSAPASYPVDPSIGIRNYLTNDEWKELDQ